MRRISQPSNHRQFLTILTNRRAASRVAALSAALLACTACGIEPGDGEAAGAPHTAHDDAVDVPRAVLLASGASRTSFANAGGPAVLFLNFDGVTIVRGTGSDSHLNRSYIGGGRVPAFPGSSGQKAQVVSLVKSHFSAFNVKVVTSRPTSGDYAMIAVGGTPASIGYNASSPRVAGVAPLDCGNRLPRDIGFAFAGAIQSMVGSSLLAKYTAFAISHEAGHTFGLPHTAPACELMSYATCSGSRSFFDRNMAMQSGSEGKCGFNTINTHQTLLSTLGAAGSSGSQSPTPPTSTPPTTGGGDTTAPTVKLAVAKTQVRKGAAFVVKGSIIDDTGVVKATLDVDGKLETTKSTGTFDGSLFTVTRLAAGNHQLVVKGYDAAGNSGKATIALKVLDGSDATGSGSATGGTSKPDTSAPVIELTGPGRDSPTLLDVVGTISDDVGVVKATLWIDGVARTSTKGPFRGSLFGKGKIAAGTHKIKVTATDAAGNVGSASGSVNAIEGYDPTIVLGGCSAAPGDPLAGAGSILLLGVLWVFRRRRSRSERQ